MQLHDRHVLITGASRGVGAALVAQFARRGARVTAVARSADALTAVTSAVGARALVADLSQPDEVAGLSARVEEQGGPIDVLVNNAGIAEVRPYAATAPDAYRRHLETNLLAPMALTHQVLPGMLERGGCLTFISSMAGELAFSSICSYAVSKAGLSRFAENLRRELRGTRVNLTLAILGEIDTPMMDSGREDPDFAAMVARFPARSLSADHVADQTVRAVLDDRATLILPRIIAPAYALRRLPSRAVDLVVSPPRLGRRRS